MILLNEKSLIKIYGMKFMQLQIDDFLLDFYIESQELNDSNTMQIVQLQILNLHELLFRRIKKIN
jgi:hypothetical protein